MPIYSDIHNKNTYEDPKTSIIFENLMLLPDDVFWEIILRSAANKGILPKDAGFLMEFEFWPHWDSKGKYDADNSCFVEPDVFFRFENFDVIVEAKYSDCGGQYRGEWIREFTAYLNEYEEDKKAVYLLAVGGNDSFYKEDPIVLDKQKCPIIKFSWVEILEQVCKYENDELAEIKDYQASSISRIISNVKEGFSLMGVYTYKKKMELKGISNLFALNKAFSAVIQRETDLCTLIPYGHKEITDTYFGYKFEVHPNDGRRKSIWLHLGIWFNEQELITIGALNQDGWGDRLCSIIESGKKMASKYAKEPYSEGGYYYFEVSDLFTKEFSEVPTFDAQVKVLSKFVDEVC
ncbi:MAG: hypothetical protein HUJ63_06060, partial [Enterococcus sp.]|nr:hypothetical protein [Enterococcus sp.]